MSKFKRSVIFLCHRLPICGKSMGLLPIGFPYIGEDMGSHTIQHAIGFPEVKTVLPQVSHVWAPYRFPICCDFLRAVLIII